MEVATIWAAISSLLLALRVRGVLAVTERGARLVLLALAGALRPLAPLVLVFAAALLGDFADRAALVACVATCAAVVVRLRAVSLCLALFVVVLLRLPAFRVPLGAFVAPVAATLFPLLVSLALFALEMVFDFMLFVFVNALAVVTVNYLPEREIGLCAGLRWPAHTLWVSRVGEPHHLGGDFLTLYDISRCRCIWRAATPAFQNDWKKLLLSNPAQTAKGRTRGHQQSKLV